MANGAGRILHALENLWTRVRGENENRPGETEQALSEKLTAQNCPPESWSKVQAVLWIGNKKDWLGKLKAILTFNQYCPGCGGVLPSLIAKLHSILNGTGSWHHSVRYEAQRLWDDRQLRGDLGCKCLDYQLGMIPIPEEILEVKERWETIIFGSDGKIPEKSPFVPLLWNGKTNLPFAAFDAVPRPYGGGFASVGHVGLSLLCPEAPHLFNAKGIGSNHFGWVLHVSHNQEDRLRLVPAQDPGSKQDFGERCGAPPPAGPDGQTTACANRLGGVPDGACSARCLVRKLIPSLPDGAGEGQQTPADAAADPPASAA